MSRSLDTIRWRLDAALGDDESQELERFDSQLTLAPVEGDVEVFQSLRDDIEPLVVFLVAAVTRTSSK